MTPNIQKAIKLGLIGLAVIVGVRFTLDGVLEVKNIVTEKVAQSMKNGLLTSTLDAPQEDILLMAEDADSDLSVAVTTESETGIVTKSENIKTIVNQNGYTIFAGYKSGKISTEDFRRVDIPNSYRGVIKEGNFYYGGRKTTMKLAPNRPVTSAYFKYSAPVPSNPGEVLRKNSYTQTWENLRKKVEEKKNEQEQTAFERMTMHSSGITSNKEYSVTDVIKNAEDDRIQAQERTKIFSRQPDTTLNLRQSRIATEDKTSGTKLIFNGKSVPMTKLLGQ